MFHPRESPFERLRKSDVGLTNGKINILKMMNIYGVSSLTFNLHK